MHDEQQKLLNVSTEFVASNMIDSDDNGVVKSDIDGSIDSLMSQPSSLATTATSTNTFSKLNELFWLDLSDNRISYISSNYLPRLLYNLDLAGNLFTEIPVNVIDHLHHLKIFSLRNNLITHLTDVKLANNQLNLKKFDMQKNLIKVLPPYLFNGSIDAEVLMLDKNLISKLPNDAFKNLSVNDLSLSHNRINAISDGAFNGLENTLEHLDLAYNGIKDITKALLTLNRLRYLDLTSNAISFIDFFPNTMEVISLGANNFTAIPLDGLKMCTNLTYLDLGFNKITEIPENCFDDWGDHLKVLHLRNNKITSLNEGSFNGLDKIKELTLGYNDIHYVYPMSFANISATLKILELSFGLYRDDFPIEQFKYTTELMWLALDNNNLKIISDESLTIIEQLLYINLSFNRIMVFPAYTFNADVHKKLKEVELSYNALTRLYTNTFDSLIYLRYVYLSSNRIETLDRNCFHNLPNLAFIDLSHNLLRNISENVFTFLPTLLQLDLTYNQLEYFTMRIFKHVSNETMPLRLNVSHNHLTVIDGEISSFLYIYSIDATSNYLSDFQGFRNLGSNLKVLLLRENNITALYNHALSELSNLEILDISMNRIQVIRRRCFQGLATLQKLDLSFNRIEQLQIDQFSNLRKLRILNLSHNKLRSLPRQVFENTHIEYLDLSYNQLSMWPASSFSDIGFTIRNILIAANQIEYLEPTMFLNTQFVYNLNLSKNKILLIPDSTFSYLTNLTSLDLSYNPLVTTNLREVFHYTPMVRVLRLKSIRLNELPSLSDMKQLTELDVSMNNLQKTCQLNGLQHLRVLKIAQNKVTNISTLAQQLPSSMRVLDISRNPIGKITSQDFIRLRHLEELYMEDVVVTSAMAFSKLKHLKIFHFDVQPLFSDVVANLYGLEALKIKANAQVFGDNVLIKLKNHTKLHTLEIHGKQLINITPNAFAGLSNNHRMLLHIHDTQISDFPPTVFYSLRSISHLTIDLSNNNLANLAPDSFYPNASSWDAVGTRSIIGGLYIAGNPLQCDCGMVWLGHWLRRWLREIAQNNTITREEFKTIVEVSKIIAVIAFNIRIFMLDLSY